MKARLMLATVLAAFAAPTAAQDITGQWFGTLETGSAKLRVLIHLNKTQAGIDGAMDSLDQGATGLKITSVSLDKSSVKFRVDAVRGQYAGSLTADGEKIHGTWNQGQPTELNLRRVKPSQINGTWSGALDLGPTKLRLVLRVINAPDGLVAILESPDQGNAVIPVSAVTHEGPAFHFEAATVGARFEGKMRKDLDAIDGIFTQGGRAMPLALKRGQLEKPRRPQTPVKPYPYREEEVVYENKQAGIKLAGTLTIPQGKGPFPAALLITGSGQQDRDESLMDHKPFLVLADYLTRKGIVVLRADDRGMGGSGGNFATSTTADFATDAESGVAFLKTRPEVNPRKIGLIGHSEGGVIAPMLASRNWGIAFIVMMAGTGVPGDQIIVEQTRLAVLGQGLPPEQAAAAAAKQGEIVALVRDERDIAELKRKLREKLAEQVAAARVESSIAQLTSPWYRYFISFDPATALGKVSCPVLAIIGEKDTQVPPNLNLPAIRKALSGNQNATVEELAGLNHLFQTAKTGAVSEYAQIEETISPVALEKMANWVQRQ